MILEGNACVITEVTLNTFDIFIALHIIYQLSLKDKGLKGVVRLHLYVRVILLNYFLLDDLKIYWPYVLYVDEAKRDNLNELENNEDCIFFITMLLV